MKHKHWNHHAVPKPKPTNGPNSWEKRYADLLETLKRDGKIADWIYEPSSLKLFEVEESKRRYTPDFMVVFPDRRVRFVEVKGRQREDAILKFEAAAARYWWFEFVMVTIDSKTKAWKILKEYNMEVTDERQDMD
jgi:hypothetical protein